MHMFTLRDDVLATHNVVRRAQSVDGVVLDADNGEGETYEEIRALMLFILTDAPYVRIGEPAERCAAGPYVASSNFALSEVLDASTLSQL